MSGLPFPLSAAEHEFDEVWGQPRPPAGNGWALVATERLHGWEYRNGSGIDPMLVFVWARRKDRKPLRHPMSDAGVEMKPEGLAFLLDTIASLKARLDAANRKLNPPSNRHPLDKA